MDVNIKNITLTELGDYNKLNSMLNIKPLKYTPTHIEFDIHGDTSIANALRRILLSETKAKRLEVTSMDNIECTDNYIIKDNLMLVIKSIKIDQKIPLGSKFNLIQENNTEKSIRIRSKEIKSVTGQEQPFNESIIITDLLSGKKLSIKNIEVVEDYVSVPGSISFKCLDIDTEKKHSILYYQHKIGMDMNGEIEANEYIKMGCTQFIDRVKYLQKIYKEPQDIITKTILGEIATYTIINEDHTLGHLIYKYICFEVPNIKFCTYYMLHPSKNILIIKINHPEHEKLFLKALQGCIDIFEKIKTTF